MFIAGDAAHSHPPYGGFGLNNGLEDAVNLGWKLAAKLDGWGGDTLLASYSEERRPIFQEVAEDFIAARIRNDGAFLGRYSPARDKAEFEAAWKAQESDVGNRAQVYEPNYEGSPVVIGPPGGKSTAHGKHVFKARAGHHLPPQMLSSGRNVFEELGRGFTLLAFDVGGRDVAAFEQAAAALNVPLKVVRDSLRRRPDEIRDAHDPGAAGPVHRLDRRPPATGANAVPADHVASVAGRDSAAPCGRRRPCGTRRRSPVRRRERCASRLAGVRGSPLIVVHSCLAESRTTPPDCRRRSACASSRPAPSRASGRAAPRRSASA